MKHDRGIDIEEEREGDEERSLTCAPACGRKQISLMKLVDVCASSSIFSSSLWMICFPFWVRLKKKIIET